MGNSQGGGATMKAYVREGSGMRFRDDWPRPGGPSGKEVLVQVRSAGINPVDYKAPKLLLGSVVGLDVCGIVEAVGESPFKVGDRVYGTTKGSLAERAICNSAALSLAPETLPDEMCAAIPTVYVTALQALRDYGNLQCGGSVLVIGASGGCGLAGVQVAIALGAKTVVGVCSGKNRDIVLENGATRVIDYTQENFWEQDEKFDIVFDTATNSGGNEDYKEHALSVLKPDADGGESGHGHGQYVAINGFISMWLRAFTIGQKKNEHLFLTDVNTGDLDLIRTFVMEGKIKPVVQTTLQLNADDLQHGFEQLKSRRTVGKITFKVSDS